MGKQEVIAFLGKAGCVDKDTEFLSKDKGWLKISDYNGEDIAVYDKDGYITFERPQDYLVYNADEWYILKHSRGLDMKVSPEHRMCYISSKGNLCIKPMSLIYQQHLNNVSGFSSRFISTFNTSSTYELPISDELLRMYVAIQADGRILAQKDKYRVNLKKDRKKERFEWLLHANNIRYTTVIGKEGTTTEGYTAYEFYLQGAFKEFPKEWYTLSHRQLAIIAEEANYWDGYLNNPRGVLNYSSISKNNADFIQFANTVATGYRTSISIDNRLGGIHKHICYTVHGTYTKGVAAHKRSHGITREHIIQKESAAIKESKYCFTTSTGMWLMRRGNNIYVTGNSGKNYQSDRFIRRGYKKLSFADPLRKMACHVIGLDFTEAMKVYDRLKVTPICNGLTFRNILENLGSGVREIDEDFWVKAVIKGIRETTKNIVIDDMRYANEFIEIYRFCQEHNIVFKAYLCDYHSDRYDANNPHESAALANHLVDALHLLDLQEVKIDMILEYANKTGVLKLQDIVAEKLQEMKGSKFFGRQ